MSLWLKGAIQERGCEGQGCPGCRYQIYKDRDVCACEGIKQSDGYITAIKLWHLLSRPEKGRRLRKIYDEMEEDEEVPFMNLSQIKEAVSLFAGLNKALYELTGSVHYRFNPIVFDWIIKKHSDLITHWKNPDGTEVYTLVNSLTKAESTEHYLRSALRVSKPVEFD